MGNYNSGNRKSDKKGLVTNYKTIDSYTLKQDGRLQVTIGEEKQIINITYNDKKRHGGKVYYLECPVCKLRVRFLYVKKTGIACRTCQNLTYESSQCKNKYTGLAKSIFEGMPIDEKFAKSFFRDRQARN